MKETDIENIKRILDHFGSNNQIYKTIEELAELQKALVELLQHPENENVSKKISNIKEEIVDVLIMLKQLQFMFWFKDVELYNMTSEKIEKTFEKYNIKKEK